MWNIPEKTGVFAFWPSRSMPRLASALPGSNLAHHTQSSDCLLRPGCWDLTWTYQKLEMGGLGHWRHLHSSEPPPNGAPASYLSPGWHDRSPRVGKGLDRDGDLGEK